MKKIFIAAVMAIAVSTSAFADASKVSSVIRNNFAADFSGVSDVEWKTTAEYTKATFVLEGAKVEAFYNAQGELFATGKSIAMNALPKKALETISKKYAGYTVREAVSVKDVQGSSKEYVSLENNSFKVILEIDSEGSSSVFSKTKK